MNLDFKIKKRIHLKFSPKAPKIVEPALAVVSWVGHDVAILGRVMDEPTKILDV